MANTILSHSFGNLDEVNFQIDIQLIDVVMKKLFFNANDKEDITELALSMFDAQCG